MTSTVQNFPHYILGSWCDNDFEVYTYETIEKAVRQNYGSETETQYLLEVGITAAGRVYTLDVTDRFIAAWRKLEDEALAEEWRELPQGRENDHFTSRGSLENYIHAHRLGPPLRTPSANPNLLAAE